MKKSQEQNSIIEVLTKNSSIPHFDAEILLSFVLNKSREYIISHPEIILTSTQITKFQKFINRRKDNEPVAYLTGHKEFYGLDFLVNKHTLIPRPETELIIDKTMDLISGDLTNTNIIDVGTGSGCIIITLAKLLKNKNIQFFGIDISPQALQIAKKNAKSHHLNSYIKFIKGNLLQPILKHKKLLITNSKFLITANLPYLTPAQIKSSPSIQHEPKLALIAGDDGLKYYRQLFKQIKELKKLSPKSQISILCEIDHTQTKKIKQLIKDKLPLAKFNVIKDLGGYDRLVLISIE